MIRLAFEPLGEVADHRAFAVYEWHGAWRYRVVRNVVFHFPAHLVRFRRLSGHGWATHEDGRLDVDQGYTWDGPSGPAINCEASVVASLVHDIVCELVLTAPGKHAYPCGYFRAHRLYRMICRAQGMHPVRAWYQWTALVACNWAIRV